MAQNSHVTTIEPLTIRPKEAAKLLSISERKFNEMRAVGQLPPAIKLGGCLLYRVEDLRQWLAWDCPTLDKFEQLREGKR